MPTRIDYHRVPLGATQVMCNLQLDVDTCGLEPALPPENTKPPGGAL